MSPRIALPLLLIAGFGLGWLLRPVIVGGDDAPDAGHAAPQGGLPTDAPEAEAAYLSPSPTALRVERERRREAERQVEELRGEVERLQAEVARAPSSSEEAEGGPAVPTVQFAGFEEALGAVDFAVAGEALSHMVPLIDELVTSLEAGEELPASVGDIQRWNGPLINQARAAQQKGLPGTGTNGAFTHPSMVVNMVIATLAQAGSPLSESQIRTMETVGTRFLEEDARRRAVYGPKTLKLQEVYDEADLKQQLYDEIDLLVTPEQRDLLHPAHVRGRLGADVFSTGLLWSQFAQPVPYKDPDELPAALQRWLEVNTSLLEHLDETDLQAITERWAASFTPLERMREADVLDRRGMMHREQVVAAAAYQLPILADLLTRVSGEAAETIRGSRAVLVPSYRP